MEYKSELLCNEAHYILICKCSLTCRNDCSKGN
uniref:Uncharacterized protein n=1 Tax=Anguilla anguilla TaxID=7936 RepID=A0A0E9TYP3_ANGAN